MPNGPLAKIASIYRYPVKGLSPEQMPAVTLSPGKTLSADRRYAIENGPSGFDPADPKYFPKIYFLMLMRNERLAGLRTHFDYTTNIFTIRHNGAEAVRGNLDTAEGRAAVEAFFAREFASDLKGFGVLDLVSCWYWKAAKYMQTAHVGAAFVSTNSITQGEQVGLLWAPLMLRFGLHIKFAHRTFRWSNEARGIAAVVVDGPPIGKPMMQGNGRQAISLHNRVHWHS